MEIAGRTAIVTGGGIGAAVAERLVRGGARVLIVDVDTGAARAVADRLDAEAPGAVRAAGADVADATRIRELLDIAEAELGPVGLYFANAGVGGPAGLGDENDDWDLALDVNLNAHVRAARELMPRWSDRGEGYFISTASAAGLLTQIGSAAYATTKHAAVGFAEWLSVTYGGGGIRVSCLCPMGVDTRMLYAGRESGDELGAAGTEAVISAGEVLTPARVADVVMDAISDERFLILPHEEVLGMYRQKGSDYERWLRGMRRLQDRVLDNQ